MAVMYYVSTNRGATLVAAMSPNGAEAMVNNIDGVKAANSVRLATARDVEYVRGMGGRVPESAEIRGNNAIC